MKKQRELKNPKNKYEIQMVIIITINIKANFYLAYYTGGIYDFNRRSKNRN